jgi:hypothetical protein
VVGNVEDQLAEGGGVEDAGVIIALDLSARITSHSRLRRATAERSTTLF